MTRSNSIDELIYNPEIKRITRRLRKEMRSRKRTLKILHSITPNLGSFSKIFCNNFDLTLVVHITREMKMNGNQTLSKLRHP